jgi:hypothetical protein
MNGSRGHREEGIRMSLYCLLSFYIQGPKMAKYSFQGAEEKRESAS